MRSPRPASLLSLEVVHRRIRRHCAGHPDIINASKPRPRPADSVCASRRALSLPASGIGVGVARRAPSADAPAAAGTLIHASEIVSGTPVRRDRLSCTGAQARGAARMPLGATESEAECMPCRLTARHAADGTHSYATPPAAPTSVRGKLPCRNENAQSFESDLRRAASSL